MSLRTTLFAATFVTAPLALPAQDFLHYTFEGACSTEIVDHSFAGYGNGTLQATWGSGYDVGYQGDGLAAGNPLSGQRNLVQTAWDPTAAPLTGDMTIMFRARQGEAFTTQLSYLFGRSSSGFRLFTNGSAGRGLYLRDAVAGSTTEILLPASTYDFQTAAANSWVHIAIAIDATAGTGSWYANGTLLSSTPGLTGASILGSGLLQLGGFASATGSCYDLDDVLFSRRLYSAVEIAALANGQRAGQGRYDHGTTTQCNPGGVTLDTIGGPPVRGNPLYTLRITPSQPSLWLLSYGGQRCSFAGLAPLPLDGGLVLPVLTGCTLLADPMILLSGFAGPANPGTVALPLQPSLAMGAAAYCQAVALQLPNTVAMSNGLAISVGL